jgi:hypothetical protein
MYEMKLREPAGQRVIHEIHHLEIALHGHDELIRPVGRTKLD